MKLQKKILTVILVLLFLSFFLFIWEYLVDKYQIPKRILPRPSIIGNYLLSELFTEHRASYVSLLEKTSQSFIDALWGFGISIILGTAIGILFAKSRLIHKTLLPPLFIIQLLPIPAFAPVIASILGYGIETKILVIVLFTIFPVTVVVCDAVLNIPRNYISLIKSYNTPRIKQFFELVLPSITPNLFTTMKILCTASFVGSIIAELPLTVSAGIGKDIYTSFNNQVVARVWSSLILISIISLIFFGIISLFEKVILEKYKYGKFI